MTMPIADFEGRNLNQLYRTLSAHMNMPEAQVRDLARGNLTELITQINTARAQNSTLTAALQSQHNILTPDQLQAALLQVDTEARKSFFRRWITEPVGTVTGTVNDWVLRPVGKVLNNGAVQTALLGLGLFFGFKWLLEKLKEAKKDSEDKSMSGLFGSLFYSNANASMRKRDSFGKKGFGQEKGPNELPKAPQPASAEDEPGLEFKPFRKFLKK